MTKLTSLSTVFSCQFIAGVKSPEECLLVTLAKGISSTFVSVGFILRVVKKWFLSQPISLTLLTIISIFLSLCLTKKSLKLFIVSASSLGEFIIMYWCCPLKILCKRIKKSVPLVGGNVPSTTTNENGADNNKLVSLVTVEVLP